MSEGAARHRETQAISVSTRIDSAHAPREAGPMPDSIDDSAQEMVDAISGEDAGYLGEQLRQQAGELSAHLQSQQQQLERREAEYHSRVARLENEVRMSRLMLQEREQALSARQWELDQTHVEERTAEVQPAGPVDEGHHDLKDRHATGADPQQLDRHLPRTFEAGLDKKLRAVDERRLELERRRAAIDQLYAEVMRVHRDSLEMRLCTEQLWAEMSGKASQPELMHRLGELRKRLADHFRLANEAVLRRTGELEQLLLRLDEQQKRMQHHRSEMQRWLARRETEIEEQAARLVARQQELDRQAVQMKQRQEQWDGQRREYQEEIRRLMAKLRKVSTAGQL